MSSNGKAVPQSLEFEEIAPLRIPVRIGNRHYVLRQAMAGDVILYRNFIVRTTRVSAQDRVATSQGYADSEPFLLSLCMREVDADGGNERPVGIQVIKGWTNTVLNKLFDLCQQISGMLDDEDQTEEELTRQRDEATAKLEALEQARGSGKPAEDAHETLVKN